MRTALARGLRPRDRLSPVPQSRIEFLAAPTQGWDTETPVAELPQTRARVLDNFLPNGVSITIRKGVDEHVTGIGSAVETLMPYNAGASQVMFAAAGTAIYNVTAAGAVGAAVVTSLTNARFGHVNFRTTGGAYLWICNGADDPRHWNGSAWAVPSLSMTTYNDNDIFYVFESKQRLFFLFNNALTFGYLPADSVAGTVANFGVGSVFTYGGRLVAGGKIARDSGDGLDDYTCFLTSEGELVVYSGSNPADANDWARVGTYFVGEPVGDRPIIDLGGDLGVITVNGVVSVLAVMAGQFNAPDAGAYVSARVATPFRATVAVGRAHEGWEGLLVPSSDLMIVNMPLTATTAVQFVRHRTTGAWCRFTGWDFACFEVLGATLYAGGFDGTVYECFTGHDDADDDITAAHSTAWSSLGTPLTKTLHEARALLTTSTRASLRMVARTDFRDAPPLGSWPFSTISNALIWNANNWNEALWNGEDATTRQWRAVSGEGHAVSLVVEARSNQGEFSTNGYQVTFSVGAAR